MFALELDEAVIAAFFAVREFAANRRTGFVDGATAQIGVQKLAGGLVDVVGTMPENALFNVIVRVAFGKFIIARKSDLGALIGKTEVFGQPLDIAFRYNDARVAAAITGAFATVIVYFCICYARIL